MTLVAPHFCDGSYTSQSVDPHFTQWTHTSVMGPIQVSQWTHTLLTSVMGPMQVTQWTHTFVMGPIQVSQWTHTSVMGSIHVIHWRCMSLSEKPENTLLSLKLLENIFIIHTFPIMGCFAIVVLVYKVLKVSYKNSPGSPFFDSFWSLFGPFFTKNLVPFWSL